MGKSQGRHWLPPAGNAVQRMSLVFQRATARMAQLIPQKADPRQRFQTQRTNMCGVAQLSVNFAHGRAILRVPCLCLRVLLLFRKGGGCRADDAIHHEFNMDRKQGWQEPPATAALDSRAIGSAAALTNGGEANPRTDPDMDGPPSEPTAGAYSEGHAIGLL